MYRVHGRRGVGTLLYLLLPKSAYT
jgi:hypothetical protein